MALLGLLTADLIGEIRPDQCVRRLSPDRTKVLVKKDKNLEVEERWSRSRHLDQSDV